MSPDAGQRRRPAATGRSQASQVAGIQPERRPGEPGRGDAMSSDWCGLVVLYSGGCGHGDTGWIRA